MSKFWEIGSWQPRVLSCHEWLTQTSARAHTLLLALLALLGLAGIVFARIERVFPAKPAAQRDSRYFGLITADCCGQVNSSAVPKPAAGAGFPRLAVLETYGVAAFCMCWH